MTTRRNERERLAAHMGRVLREARLRASLTQADVAERVGLVTEVLGRTERGHMLPSVPTLRKLCRVLRVDANTLLGLDIDKAPLWLEAPEPEADEPPELRRLVRTLRQMDAAQLAVVSCTANALLRHTGQRQDEDEQSE
jgi:transcriptional regulator with XRE-family HTH domain